MSLSGPVPTPHRHAVRLRSRYVVFEHAGRRPYDRLTVASAVEEQGAATKEIARNVQQASAGTTEASRSIGGVTLSCNARGAEAAPPAGTFRLPVSVLRPSNPAVKKAAGAQERAPSLV